MSTIQLPRSHSFWSTHTPLPGPSLSTHVHECCHVEAIAIVLWQYLECHELDASYYVLGSVLSIFWIIQLINAHDCSMSKYLMACILLMRKLRLRRVALSRVLQLEYGRARTGIGVSSLNANLLCCFLLYV